MLPTVSHVANWRWPRRGKSWPSFLPAARWSLAGLTAFVLAVLPLTQTVPIYSSGIAAAQEPQKDPRVDSWDPLTDTEKQTVQELIDQRRHQDALDALAGILKGKGWNFDTMAGGKPRFDSDMDPAFAGETDPAVGGEVRIGSGAFQHGFGWLYSCIMHELVHSHQFQDPTNVNAWINGTEADRARIELEAYQRQLDNADAPETPEWLKRWLENKIQELQRQIEETERDEGDDETENGDTIRPDPSFIQPKSLAALPSATIADGLTARISIPSSDALVRGSVPVFGLACGDSFAEYRLEYGEGAAPQQWTTIATSSTPQPDAGVPDNLSEFGGDTTLYGNLGNWDTGLREYVYMPTYPPDHPVNLGGVYTLRLVVRGQDGTQVEDRATVEVGGVIPNAWGATVASWDGNVILTVPEQAIRDSFRVVSIRPTDDPVPPIPAGHTLVGAAYQFREPGESFTKDVTLEMRYSLDELADISPGRLGIYLYQPASESWVPLPTARKEAEGKLVARIAEFPGEHAYFAILASQSQVGSTVYEPPAVVSPPQGATGGGEVLVLDTFDDGSTGEWSNRDRDVGATISIDSALSLDASHALRITNANEGGNFAVNVRRTPFDAGEYPVIEFDYRVPPGVKTDLYVKVAGRWYNVQFTDDAKALDYKRVNIAGIGRIPGVVADNRWHKAQFDLAQMLAPKTGNHVVQEMIFADWDVRGYMRLTYGRNRAGASFLVDNFTIRRGPGDAVPSNKLNAGTWVIDDFESGSDANALGWDTRLFSARGATIEREYRGDGTGGSDQALQLSFGGPIGELFTYAGWATSLGGIDASDADTLTLRIRGTAGGERPNLYLDDGTERYYVDIEDYTALTQEWQAVSVPLERFAEQGVDLSHLKELQIVFEWERMEGALLLDDLALNFTD